VAYVDSTTSSGDDTGLLIVAIGVAIFAVWGMVAGYRSYKRRIEIEAVARKAGLQYAETDPFQCTRIRFPLFSKGDGRGADNVLWRDHADGTSYRAFDYWFYDEHEDQYGRVSKTYHRYSCAMAYMGSSWPELTIVKEGLTEKAFSALGVGDIDFESEEFNRTFAVRCLDRKFATACLDARMIDLLVSTKGELSFALKGRWLLIWRKPVPARLVPGLVALAEKVVATIPRVVWELYPSTFRNDDGTVLPPEDEGLFSRLEPSVASVFREQLAEEAAREPKVEYDLDGHPIQPVEEDPWGDEG
jgi:hypothetical protein